MSAALVLGLGFLQTRMALGETPPGDGAPSGIVVFVAGGKCPPGWEHVYDLEGRIAVGAIYPEHVGLTVGMPLGDQEERTHEHAYSGEVTLPAKSIAAANGPNQSGAAAGKYSLKGGTTKAPTGLPFMQIEGCVKP